MVRILVTGAGGQIGSELTPALRDQHGSDAVVATGLSEALPGDGPTEIVDVTNRDQLRTVVERYDIDHIFHLAAILSAHGEQHPDLAYRVNVEGLMNVFEVSREMAVSKLVVPSTIAVFGPDTPDNPTETTILRPTTMYGISKVFLELLANYYHETFGLDVRGVRFPGIISHKTKPSGGTTDYAVEAFYDAIESGSYRYFVREDTVMPMMYMPDAVSALLQLTAAPSADLRYRCEYNVAALSFTPAELTAEIRRHVPDFEAQYDPDDRQEIADSWPNSLDDTAAREDWGWEPAYDLRMMVDDMVQNLRVKLA